MDSENRYRLYLPILVSLGLYVFIGYFTERTDHVLLLSAFAALFAMYLWLALKSASGQLNTLIFAGLAFRLVLLFTFPSLSDDIYRFVWDGRLLQTGVSPFAELPSAIMSSGDLPGGLTQELYVQLNSPDYFTIYPPFAQLIFWLSVVISPSSTLGSAIVMRVFIILAEIGTIYFLLKFCDNFNLDRKQVLWYALNPLVIIELTGNLHYEAFMIFFLMAGIYFLLKNKTLLSAFFWALAIASKLLPLILLPVFLRRIKLERLLKFYLLTGLFSILSFLPLLSIELIEGMTSSISLYFQSFEFNASIYYVIRAIGYQQKGYNIIGQAGPILAAITFLTIVGYSWLTYRNKLSVVCLFVMLFYFLMATTVHPWYITTLVAFAALTRYRFAIVWSAVIFFTYAGYTSIGYHENLWLIAIEYVIVIVYMLYEIFRFNNEKQVDTSA